MSTEGQTLINQLAVVEQCVVSIASDIGQIKSTLNEHGATLADIKQCACHPDYSPILDAIQDTKVSIVSRVDGFEAVVLQNLISLENILVAAINDLRDVFLGAIGTIRDILLAAINGLKDVLLAIFGGKNVEEILEAIAALRSFVATAHGETRGYLTGQVTAAHLSTRQIILDSIIGKLDAGFANADADLTRIEQLVRDLDFEGLTEQQARDIVAAAHLSTRQIILDSIIGKLDAGFANADADLARIEQLVRDLDFEDIAEVQEQNNELLETLSEIIGVDEYPASLPASLISKDEGFLGNLIPNENVSIPNLTRLLGWYIERFDEIMGQFEIPIEIKDSDPSTPGNQPVGIKLPNMAEAIAELFLLTFQTHINCETLINLTTRNLIETGTDKQQNFVTYKLLQSLTDWVGFKQKDIKLEMPLLFNPTKTRFDELLQETKVKVNCVEFDEKFGLEADLMRFRKAASILDSVFYRKINPRGDVKQQLIDYLLDSYRSMNKINKNDDDTFEEFLNEVEEGFKNVPGITNPDEPYGKPYEQRPRIRDLTNYQPPNP